MKILSIKLASSHNGKQKEFSHTDVERRFKKWLSEKPVLWLSSLDVNHVVKEFIKYGLYCTYDEGDFSLVMTMITESGLLPIPE